MGGGELGDGVGKGGGRMRWRRGGMGGNGELGDGEGNEGMGWRWEG